MKNFTINRPSICSKTISRVNPSSNEKLKFLLIFCVTDFPFRRVKKINSKKDLQPDVKRRRNIAKIKNLSNISFLFIFLGSRLSIFISILRWQIKSEIEIAKRNLLLDFFLFFSKRKSRYSKKIKINWKIWRLLCQQLLEAYFCHFLSKKFLK